MELRQMSTAMEYFPLLHCSAHCFVPTFNSSSSPTRPCPILCLCCCCCCCSRGRNRHDGEEYFALGLVFRVVISNTHVWKVFSVQICVHWDSHSVVLLLEMDMLCIRIHICWWCCCCCRCQCFTLVVLVVLWPRPTKQRFVSHWELIPCFFFLLKSLFHSAGWWTKPMCKLFLSLVHK